MSSSNYLFVNKGVDSGSLSHSEKSERVKIHSHVQLGQIYGRKNNLREQQANDTSNQPDSKPGRTDQAPQVLRWKLSQATKRRKRPSKSSPPNDEDGLMLYQTRHQSSTPPSQLMFPHILHSPQQEDPTLDPFDVSRVQMNAEVQRLMQYFLRAAYPNTWHLQSRLSKKQRSSLQRNAEVILKSCFDNDVNLFTMLAAMSSRLRYLEQYDDQSDNPEYFSKAIAAIQSHITSESAVDERLIFNMFQMGNAEFFRWNTDGALIHLKAIKTLVDRMGGLRQMNPALIEMLVIGDGYLASELMQKPVFSASDFDIEDEELNRCFGMAKLECLLSGATIIAAGLLSRGIAEIMPSRLRWIVIDMAVCLMVLQDVTDGNLTDDDSFEALHWLHVRNLAIRHRLLLLDNLSDLRMHAIRCALLMWNFLIFTKAGRQRTAGVIAQKLQETLLEVEEDSWEEFQDVRLWILLIGATSSHPKDAWHAWFVRELLEARTTPDSFERLPNLEAASLQNLSERFLHYHPIQYPMLEKLADETASMED